MEEEGLGPAEAFGKHLEEGSMPGKQPNKSTGTEAGGHVDHEGIAHGLLL